MKTTYKNFTLTSTYKGDKKANWGDDSRYENWNNHVISVRNNDNKKATRFEFWESIQEREIKNERQLLWAFECFLGDVISGDYDFNEFCNEFGYDNDSRKAYKIYKACVRAKEKFSRIYNDDIYDFSNELREHLEN